MNLGELKGALKSGVTLIWQGTRDYENAIGRLTGIILRSGPTGEDVFSCELTTILAKGRSVIICRPEELRFYNPSDQEVN